MRRATIAALAVLLVCAGANAQRRLPNSFTLKPTPTTESLVQHVKESPILMDRYVRHFQMTPDEVVRFMSGLHVVSLPSDAHFEVFNVPAATGELRSRRMPFKKGEKFFADASGNYILVVVCGNPVVRMDEADALTPAAAVSNAAGLTTIEVPKAGAIVSQMTLMQPAVPVVPDVTFEKPEEAVTTTTTGGAPFAGLGLGLLPALFVGLNQGGGQPVPEPSSIAALGVGVALLAARLRRRVR